MSSTLSVLELFRNGHDTRDIASLLKVPEAVVLQQVTSERSSVLRLPNPYPSHKVLWPSGRLAYAGRE